MTAITYTGETWVRQGIQIKKSPFLPGGLMWICLSSPVLLQHFFFVLKKVNIPLWIRDSDTFLIKAFLNRFG